MLTHKEKVFNTYFLCCQKIQNKLYCIQFQKIRSFIMQSLLLPMSLLFPINVESFDDSLLKKKRELKKDTSVWASFSNLQEYVAGEDSFSEKLELTFSTHLFWGIFLASAFTVFSIYTNTSLSWTYLAQLVGCSLLSLNISSFSDSMYGSSMACARKILHKLFLVGMIISQLTHAIIFPTPIYITSAILTLLLPLMQTYNTRHLSHYIESLPEKKRMSYFCHMVLLTQNVDHPDGLKKIRNFLICSTICHIGAFMLTLFIALYSSQTTLLAFFCCGRTGLSMLAELLKMISSMCAMCELQQKNTQLERDTEKQQESFLTSPLFL